MERQYHLRLFKDGKLKYQVVLSWGWDSGKGFPHFLLQRWLGRSGSGTEIKGWEKLTGQKANKEQVWPPMASPRPPIAFHNPHGLPCPQWIPISPCSLPQSLMVSQWLPMAPNGFQYSPPPRLSMAPMASHASNDSPWPPLASHDLP